MRGLSLLSLTAVLVLALGAPCVGQKRNRVESLTRDVLALQTLRELRLNPAQCRALIPVLEKAATAESELHLAEAAYRGDYLNALREFHAIRSRDLGIPEDAMLRLRKALRLWTRGIRSYNRTLHDQEGRLRGILSPRQAVTAGLVAAPPNRRPTRRGREIELILNGVRMASPAGYLQLRGAWAGTILRAAGRDGDSDEELAYVFKSFDGIRSLEQTEFDARRRDLMHEVMTSPIERAHKKLDSVKRELNHTITRGGELLLTPCLLAALDPRGHGEFSRLPTLAFSDEEVAEARILRDEISTLNLVNGLHLGAKQMRAIRAGVQEIDRLRGSGSSTMNDVATIRLLVSVRSRLLSNQALPASLRRALSRVTAPKSHPRAKQAVARIAANLTSDLSPAQAEVLSLFRYCTIPPMNLRDPVRVGQAEQPPGFLPLFRRLSGIPEQRYTAVVDRLLERHLRHMEEQNGFLASDERRAALQVLRSAADRAHAADPIELEFMAEDLAEEIRPFLRKTAARKNYQDLERASQGGTLSRVARFLLHPSMGPVLTCRLARPAPAPHTLGPGLAGVPAAESCVEGECALKDEPPVSGGIQ